MFTLFNPPGGILTKNNIQSEGTQPKSEGTQPKKHKCQSACL